MSDLEDSYRQVLKGVEPELVWSDGEVVVSRLTSNLWMIDTDNSDESLASAFEYLSGKRLIPEHFDKWWTDRYSETRMKITMLTRDVEDDPQDDTVV